MYDIIENDIYMSKIYRYKTRYAEMICKKCGSDLKEGELVCSSCGEETEKSTEEQIAEKPLVTAEKSEEVQNEIKTTLKDKVDNFLAMVKKKTNARSILDDEVAFSLGEKKLAVKYFFLAICSLLLITFWFAKNVSFKLGYLDAIELIGFDFGPLRFSLNDFVRVLSSVENILSVIGEIEISDIPPKLLTVLSVISVTYTIATIAVCIAPAFAFLALLHGSFTKKLWVTVVSRLLIFGFIIHFGYFFLLKIGVGALSAELESDIVLSMSFAGVVLILLYIIAFIIIRSIKKQLKGEQEVRVRAKVSGE